MDIVQFTARKINGLLFRTKKLYIGLSRAVSKNKSGINLIGFFPYAFGVAEIGRFFARHMIEAELPFSIYNISSESHKKLDPESLSLYKAYFTHKPVFHRNLFFINAEQMGWIKNAFPTLFIGRHNAAVFFWEFDDYFHFEEGFKTVHEAIALTEFVATALRKSAPAGVKVTKLPIPFIKNWEITKTTQVVRKQYGIPAAAYTFIFNFDFNSIYDRKNPEAIVHAMHKAFTAADDVCLVLKTIGASTTSANFRKFQTLLSQMQLQRKVVLVNENLSRNELMNLINSADCYISLHRSEGLGLGMLEAMSMGKPVIGTNFGGNTDFMNSTNALLVNYTPVAVKPGNEPYKAGWLWAEPNVEQAATYMHQLYTDRIFGSELGAKAALSIKRQFDVSTFKTELIRWMQL